ncbi:CBS domain-containing protein [Halosegnis marinus]|uniref:Zinc metalloprotease n=1 Tax=Halosegnis marinus TaxID=3034023 RepID=A0ABD5ZPB3_9EURY|nr:CBS domain-containing protein [Halosegnis sp. DT85]
MRSFRIGRLFGIPIELDLTFLLVLPLFAYLIGSSLGEYAGLLNDVLGPAAAVDITALTGDPVVTFGIGTLAAVGLFAGVVLHELGHSLTAMRYGFPISSITLWLFGGVAQLTEMPEDWKQELNIAVAGPVVSVALGVVSYAAFTLVAPGGGTAVAGLRFLLAYLAVMNVALAIFNMLPGFPMDGGRVLRALLARNRPYARATQIAAEVGKVFAIVLGLYGLFGNGGLFLVAIAFFIYIGASSEAQRTTMTAAFEGVTVRDIMTPEPDVHTVSPDTSVAELLRRMFTERHTGYPVVENGVVVGVVTLGDAQSVKEVERDAYTVEEVMTRELRTVGPDADAMDALDRMQETGVGRLLVMEGDDLVGIVSRTDLMTALDIIKQSGSLDAGDGGPATAERPA